MCYKYRQYVKLDGRLINKYKLKIADQPKGLFSGYYSNGFNHEMLPVITSERPDEIQYYSWGLVPDWARDYTSAKDFRNKTLNARAESIFTTASFKSAIRSQRCLIPAIGFYEWHTVGKEKYPYYITIDPNHDNIPAEFCMAGVYNTWADRDTGEVMDTFSIITTEANELMKYIHNAAGRMPLILHEKDEMTWLDPSLTESGIKSLMHSYPAADLKAYSISKLITSRRQQPDDPAVIAPFDYHALSVPPRVSLDLLPTFVC